MVGYYATLADLHPCVRIASSATLRRRFAKKMKDIGFCYPCPPTLLLPMSPADHTAMSRMRSRACSRLRLLSARRVRRRFT